MTMPSFRASGAKAEAAAATISPAIPASAVTGDILLMFVERANAVDATITNQAGGNWQQVTGSPVSIGTGTTFAGLHIFWDRYNGTQTAPTVSAAGNHQHGFISAYQNAHDTGEPFDFIGADSTGNGTAITLTGGTTTVANCLIVMAVAVADDGTEGSFFSAWTNADLSSVTKRGDTETISGNDGALGTADGGKATAGSVGSTTATIATALNWAGMVLSLKEQQVVAEVPRGPLQSGRGYQPALYPGGAA